MQYTGELAAIGTAVCWGSAASFTVTSGRRMGSLVLNRLRLTVAIVFLSSTLWVARGSPWPSWATSRELGLLAASGWLGFVLGDSLYFRALVILGAGRAALLMSLAPIFAALQARVFLGEKLGPIALAGIALTLAGLGIVLGSRPQTGPRHAEGSPLAGVLCAMVAALVVSIGHILSRAALHGGLDALSGTVIRVGTAVPLAWLLAPVQGGFARSLEALRDRIALRSMFAAALLGPCIGVSLSLLALQHTQAAIATSIFACFPLLAIVLGTRFHHERLDVRTMAGALVTVLGIAVLFLRK